MTEAGQEAVVDRNPERRFRRGIVRAFGGALIFSLPALLTVETWWLGAQMDPWRLALLLVLCLPLLTAISHFAGFEDTFGWREDLVDAFVAYAVGLVVAAVALIAMSILGRGRSLHEWVGTIALQAVGGAVGAMLARSQFGGPREQAVKEERQRRSGYAGEVLYMAVGALALSYTLAPTEEMVIIAEGMTAWNGLALVALTLLAMQGFLLAAEQRRAPAERSPALRVLWRNTMVGYVVALLISAYVLWTFGRTDATGAHAVVMTTVVLGFPAAVGAGAARIIL